MPERQARAVPAARATPEALAQAIGLWPMADIRPLSEREFGLFQALIRKEAGINLSPAKKAMLVGRLAKRLRERGLHSFSEYYELVAHLDPEERVLMLNQISTNETHFFREPKQFDSLERRFLPEWQAQADAGRRSRHVRIWSAGCSTGEEPYSIAMVLLAGLPPVRGWTHEVLATDISTRVLERAEAATWPIAKVKEVPPRFLHPFMVRCARSHEGQMRAGPELRQIVRCLRLNLNGDLYPPGLFDAIFCRNVLIYFDRPTQQAVLRRLIERLSPQGYLFLGHAESVAGHFEELQGVGQTIYTLRDAKAPRATRLGAAPRGAAGTRS